MTDSNLVKAELAAMLSFSNHEMDSYDTVVEYAVSCVCPLIKEGQDENDIRLIHLCAVKAYYQLLLMQYDGLSSFSAGEVSYSMDTSVLSNAKALLEEAVAACVDLIHGSDFAFRAV